MSKKYLLLVFIIIAAFLAPLLPACGKSQPATAYTAILPSILQAGSKQPVSVSLFAGNTLTSGNVNLALLKDGQEVARTHGKIEGNGQIFLDVPELADGDYTLQIKGNGFSDEAKVRVENRFLVFLETDKPIYKPGQTIHMRVMSLGPDLKPSDESITVEVLDAKGIKIFRSEVVTDEYGMATLDLPLSTEPNLGTWKVNAFTPQAKTQVDVRVEEYVLPKYEIKVDLPKDWFLVSEPILGKVTAVYSFGKPVKGRLAIKVIKYTGTWQDYATLDLTIDGSAEFVIPPAQYVAGIPAAQGNGNIKLEFNVTEDATGYQEKTDYLLTVSQSALNISLIPSGATFKPGLPYSLLIISETPDNHLVDTEVQVNISYLDARFQQIKSYTTKLHTQQGKSLLEINPPEDSVAFTIDCSAGDTIATRTIEAAYSPSGNFIHLEQVSEGIPSVGDDIKFWIFSTREASNFYYEVISRGTVVFSDYVKGNEITITASPAMAPSAKLLVYQILPNAEIAADYLPFEVSAGYPQKLILTTDTEEARPGDTVTIDIQAEGQSEVGLVAVDKSVYILAENRMNLQQVFDELERLYMEPQAELHEVISIWEGFTNPGARDVFKEAGVIVLTNHKLPEGKKYQSAFDNDFWLGVPEMAAADGKANRSQVAPMAPPAPMPGNTNGAGLAEVQRIRQFFPETWIWDTITTDRNGQASLSLEVPDTITTWMLRAVALSREKGLGIAENQLTVFQPFFLTVDLPYSAIRGEEFPVSVAVYNYLDEPQEVLVEIEKGDWFDLLDSSGKTVQIGAHEIGGAKFKIRPTRLGLTNAVKITARSPQAADAVIKTLIIDAEGVPQEIVNNLSLAAGQSREISTMIPETVVSDSARAFLTVTSHYLTQTMEGLEGLIQMPFGCGEQNMIIFAPDVYITKYLQESGQLKPEILAKAEKLMLTGYQRELTYRRSDGSFSAFGESDQEGSLWLTAFVLKCFSEAKGLIYIDDAVLDEARSWILSHQNADGSFDPVGFVHHAEMMGGLQGQTALTAYVTLALLQSGEQSGPAKAVPYLEKQLDNTDDPYAVALIAYTLAIAESSRSEDAYNKLMQLAREDENGLYWGGDNVVMPLEPDILPGNKMMPDSSRSQTSSIEATAYATLALIRRGDNVNASRSARWLVSQRNAYGGYGSTQDTIMALQALIEYSRGSRADVDLTVNVESSEVPDYTG